MMKKVYSAPTIEVESFDVMDIITVSTAAIKKGDVTGTDVYEVEIKTLW